MNRLALGERIDHERAADLNYKYYTTVANLDFETYAMKWSYKNAMAKKIYWFIEHWQGANFIILELGAHGVYFERGVHEGIVELDKAKGTHFADKIQYRVLDISETAIEIAEKAYRLDQNNYFTTEFYIGDALDEKAIPKNNNAIIMNELLDDLPTLVVGRTEEGLKEIIFDVSCLGNKVWLYSYGTASLNDKIGEEDEKWLLDHLDKGHVITFSPVMKVLFNNIDKSTTHESMISVHDYFTSYVDKDDSNLLKRVYGTANCENKKVEGSIQITADVPFDQLVEIMRKFGYRVKSIPTDEMIYRELKRKNVRTAEKLTGESEEQIRQRLLEARRGFKSIYLNVFGIRH